MRVIFKSLYCQVIIGIIFGIFLGYFFPKFATELKPIGEGFIQLIKMLIAPIIFGTVVMGIASVRDMKQVGRVGVKAIVYFEIVSTFALIIGLAVAHFLKPGHGMNINLDALDTSELKHLTASTVNQSFSSFLLHIIPQSVVDAFAKNEILQVLLLAILSGSILGRHHQQFPTLYHFIEEATKLCFRMVSMIMRLAPIGACGAMAYAIGKYGMETLSSLLYLIVCFYLTCALFIFGVLGVIAKLHGFSLWRLLCYLKEELLIILGTSSSESVLPQLMKKMEAYGCPRAIVSLVVPTGYSFNLDGTSIYFTMAALFIAQATGTHLSFMEQVTLLGLLLITSKGAAGVTGSGFITLAATLSVFDAIPIEGMALLLGVDRFMSEARALTNFIGNAVATVVITKWEKNQNSLPVQDTMISKNDSKAVSSESAGINSH